MLSPHPDDLALSVGGTILNLRSVGVEIKVITFFTTSTFSPYLKTDRVPEVRIEEDRSYFSSLRIEYLHLDLPDTSVRYPSNLLGKGLLEEAELLGAVTRTLADEGGALFVFSPLAVGGHLDHRIVKRGAELSFPPSKLIYYEDLPYVAEMEWTGLEGWSKCEVDIREFWDERERLLRIYRSQVSEAELELVRRYLSRGGRKVETLWTKYREVCSELGISKLI